MVKTLVEAGSDPNACTSDHKAIPVTYASANGHAEVVSYLSSLVGSKKNE